MADRIRGFEVVREDCFDKNIEVYMPKRGTAHSACYDICVGKDVIIPPHETIMEKTNIKVYMPNNEVLMVFVRSSVGKQGIVLANGTGIIDSDFFSNPDNDGNIGLLLHNNTDRHMTINKGTRVAQGLFTKFLLTDDDDANGERLGGCGSTGT
jgi:dUTP pyrophosphatase